MVAAVTDEGGAMLRTREGIRALEPEDLDRLLDLVATNPIENVLVEHRARRTRLMPHLLGGEVWGYFRGDRLVAACHAAGNLTPVAASIEIADAFADRLLREGRRCSSLVGPATAIERIWSIVRPTWGAARSIRPNQPLMALTGPPRVEPSRAVRRVRAKELDILYPACVAMFTEEIGISPESQGRGLYRSRVAQLIDQGAAFAQIEDGEVIFKAEVPAATPSACQVQGVWVNPRYRGTGMAAPGIAAVAGYAQAEFAPIVSLYVNDYNTAAIRAYERAGFVTVGRFATVML
jgi:predicted GNAT family acetyltransferase